MLTFIGFVGLRTQNGWILNYAHVSKIFLKTSLPKCGTLYGFKLRKGWQDVTKFCQVGLFLYSGTSEIQPAPEEPEVLRQIMMASSVSSGRRKRSGVLSLP